MAGNFETTTEHGEISQENLSVRLQKIIKGASLEKLEIKDQKNPQQELFRLDIKQREDWQKSLASEEMLDIFGLALLQAFSPRDQVINYDLNTDQDRTEARETLQEGDLSVADSIYIIAEQGKLVAFLAGNNLELPKGGQAYFVDLAFTDPAKRQQGYLKKIYSEIFKDLKYQAILGTSVTPAAVKQRLNTGKEFGFDGFYLGYLDGDLNQRGSSKQQEQIKAINALIRDIYVNAGLSRPQQETPEDYVVIRSEEAMPLLTAAAIKFKPDDPLIKIFERALALQQQHAPDAIYGFLISLRRD